MGANMYTEIHKCCLSGFRHREKLIELMEALVSDGKKLIGHGAAKIGNVLLQFCGLTIKHIHCIAEVNEDKFCSLILGTNIPIIFEKEARLMKPDYFFIAWN